MNNYDYDDEVPIENLNDELDDQSNNSDGTLDDIDFDDTDVTDVSSNTDISEANRSNQNINVDDIIKKGFKKKIKEELEEGLEPKVKKHSDYKMDSDTDQEINILDAYIRKHHQFIVMILGLPCSNKSEVAKELVEDLKLPIININDYLISDKFIDKEVDGVKFKLYEHPDNYDWEKLNSDVNKKKSSGLILYGNYIDSEKINFDIDFIFFLSMNTNLCKNKLIEKKLLPYESDDNKVRIYFFKIFNPIYDNLKSTLKINRFFNLKEQTTFDEIYDDVFETLMKMIQSKL